jgi:hypothetical protein
MSFDKNKLLEVFPTLVLYVIAQFSYLDYFAFHSCQSLNGGMQHHLDIHGRFSCHFGAACLICSGIINPLHIATSDLSVMAIYD